MTLAKVNIRVSRLSPISNSYWCEPIGWKPTNLVNGFPSDNGSYWDDNEEIAALVWLGVLKEGENEGDILEVDPSDLYIASCVDDCRVIAKVTIAE